MKKICIIDYDMSVRGGVEQVTAALSAALAEKYEVFVVSLCLEGELAYRLDQRVRFVSLLSKPDRLRNMGKALRPLLRAFVREQGIDTVIIQETYAGILSAPALVGMNVKRIFADHGALMNQWDRKDMVFIRLVCSLLCHRVVTLTEQNRDAYIRKFRTPRKKLTCIYNWIDLTVPRSSGYRKDSKRIISAGRFGREKGFDMLVKAFAPVAEKHPDWTLDIYGDGEMMPVVKKLVRELGLEKNVNLMGMRTDLAQRYGDYAMYVLPSYREGMPLVLLEAKANYLPIVSFDIMTGPREILRDGVDGILVPPYDLQKLGDAMCRLIESEETRLTMAERSQENIHKFDKQTILRQWETLIGEG